MQSSLHEKRNLDHHLTMASRVGIRGMNLLARILSIPQYSSSNPYMLPLVYYSIDRLSSFVFD
jgi:hypothetical protein